MAFCDSSQLAIAAVVYVRALTIPPDILKLGSERFNPFVPDPTLKRVKTGWLLRILKKSYFIARTFRLHTQVPNALEKHLK